MLAETVIPQGLSQTYLLTIQLYCIRQGRVILYSLFDFFQIRLLLVIAGHTLAHINGGFRNLTQARFFGDIFFICDGGNGCTESFPQTIPSTKTDNVSNRLGRPGTEFA